MASLFSILEKTTATTEGKPKEKRSIAFCASEHKSILQYHLADPKMVSQAVACPRYHHPSSMTTIGLQGNAVECTLKRVVRTTCT